MRLSAGWRATPGFTIRCFRLFIWPISGRADPPEHAGDNDWHFWVTARLRQGSQTRANDSAGLPGRDAGSHR